MSQQNDTLEEDCNPFIIDTLGPTDAPLVFDEFTFKQIEGEECLGRVCKNICRQLKSQKEDKEKFLCICVPAYNESKDDLMKTILSVMENMDFIKHKIRFNNDSQGKIYRHEFEALRPVIVPIFDGFKPMDESVKTWLRADFPGLLQDMDLPTAEDNVHVRVALSTWWYFCPDTLKIDNDDLERGRGSTAESSNSNISMTNKRHGHYENEGYIKFQLSPIVKKTNHRKHNSHHWFFKGIASGVNASFVFLTDCGTRYRETCIARLVYALISRPDLIGVTARQRVETPNKFFHPCERTQIWCLRGQHPGIGSPPCWKCYLSYFLSAAPLQGYEFEATFVLNSALFNLVEAMPVLPGPCQLLDWRRMRANHIVEEYFSLLFEEDGSFSSASVRRSKRLSRPRGFLSTGSLKNSLDNDMSPVRQSSTKNRESDIDELKNNDEESTDCSIVSDLEDVSLSEEVDQLHVNKSSVVNTKVSESGVLTFTEFLRVNMRLAEDRVLSFVSVFSTGYGTKWVPGATFFYEPEVTFTTLLTQRRRWINGTVASFLYFFSSSRAKNRISGGFFDSHKTGKSMRLVYFLWSLSLVQYILSLISPSVFAISLFTALSELRDLSEQYSFSLYYDNVKPHIISLIVVFYLLVYALWVAKSYTAKNGKIPEQLCFCMVIFGMLIMIPIYGCIAWSMWSHMFFVHYFILFVVLAPVFISFFQSMTSAFLYLMYLPYFMMLAIFFLVYVPSYSYARLFDTTWGNRETGRDESVTNLRELTMKRGVLKFNIALVLSNFALTFLFCFIFTSSEVQLAVIGVLFSPVIIQICGAVLYLIFIAPFRILFVDRNVITHTSFPSKDD